MEPAEELKTVVVATDFSESADGAVEWAAELAGPHGAQLVLLHASMPPVVIAAPESVAPSPEPYLSALDPVRAAPDTRVSPVRTDVPPA